jgi:hypothetical protein
MAIRPSTTFGCRAHEISSVDLTLAFAIARIADFSSDGRGMMRAPMRGSAVSRDCNSEDSMTKWHAPRTLFLWLAATLLLVFGTLATGLAVQSGSSQQATTAMTVTAGDIAKTPEKYYGKKVTVRAEVEDVLGRQVFLLDEDKLFAWPDVLVIAPKLTAAVPEDTNVTVTGTVRSFVDADFRREYNWDWWGDLDPDIVVTFRNRPAIVADSVKTTAGTDLVSR